MLLNSLGELFTFQTFDDSPKKQQALVKILHGTLEDHLLTLADLNSRGAGVFFTVNQTDLVGRGAGNITRVRALFADFDSPDHLRTFDYLCPPSYVIESSPGRHHAYWILSDALPLEDFKRYQQSLANKLGSDPKICDLPRVMRVPGFLHNKEQPFLVREIMSSPAQYSVAELTDWLRPDEHTRRSTPPADVLPNLVDDPDAITELNTICDQLRQTGEGERNNTLNKLAYQAYGLSKAGRLSRDYVTEHLLNAALDIGLDESEALTTMRSARKKAPAIPNDIDLLPDLAPSPIKRNAPAEQGDGVIMVCGADLKLRPVRWIWDQWLARGEMHLLAGAPSTGKTTICLSLAAALSSGGNWPDGTPCTQRDVVIWSGEDDYNATIGPRLLKSGADMRHVHVIQGIQEHGAKRSFDIAKDLPQLKRALLKLPNVGLIIVDPIVLAVSGDINKNNDVRKSLQPFCDLARLFKCAIVGINHLTKGTQGKDPLERLNGSVAFGALARVVMMAVKNVDEEGNIQRTFVRAKSNIGRDDGGFRYALSIGHVYAGEHEIQTSSVAWGEAVAGQARDILHDSEQTVEERSTYDEAKQFLLEYLEDGPRDSKSVSAEAKRQRISSITLRRAKDKLKIKTSKHGFGKSGGWNWELP